MDRKLAARCLAELGNLTRLDNYRLLVRAGPSGINISEIQTRLDFDPGVSSARIGQHRPRRTGKGWTRSDLPAHYHRIDSVIGSCESIVARALKTNRRQRPDAVQAATTIQIQLVQTKPVVADGRPVRACEVFEMQRDETGSSGVDRNREIAKCGGCVSAHPARARTSLWMSIGSPSARLPKDFRYENCHAQHFSAWKYGSDQR